MTALHFNKNEVRDYASIMPNSKNALSAFTLEVQNQVFDIIENLDLEGGSWNKNIIDYINRLEASGGYVKTYAKISDVTIQTVQSGVYNILKQARNWNLSSFTKQERLIVNAFKNKTKALYFWYIIDFSSWTIKVENWYRIKKISKKDYYQTIFDIAKVDLYKDKSLIEGIIAKTKLEDKRKRFKLAA